MLKQVRRRRKAGAALAPESGFRHAGSIVDGSLTPAEQNNGEAQSSSIAPGEDYHPRWCKG